MSQKSSYLSKSFFIWIFANILGISITAAIPFLFPSLLKSIQSDVVSVIIFSVPIGLAQWLALRRISHTSFLWVLTIPFGIQLYLLIYRFIPDGLRQIVDNDSLTGLTSAYILMGFSVGLLQWFILQRQFSGLLLWLLESSAGVGFSIWLILATNLINQSGIISFIVAVLTYTIIIGLILSNFLAQHSQSETNMTYLTEPFG